MRFTVCVACTAFITILGRYFAVRPTGDETARLEGSLAKSPWAPFNIGDLGTPGPCDGDTNDLQWTGSTDWPVVRETEDSVCLGRGNIAHNTPVLIDTYEGKAEACRSEGASGIKQTMWAKLRSGPDDQNAWNEAIQYHNFSTRGYFIIQPRDGTCTASTPCGLTVILHGDGDHAAYPGMPLFHAVASDSDCRTSMRSILVFPQLPSGERFDDSSWQPLEDFIVPLTKHFLQVNGSVIDEHRVFITGFSDGAIGVLLAAIGFPDVYSGAMSSSLIIGPDWSYWQANGAHWEASGRSDVYAAMKKRRDARLETGQQKVEDNKLKAVAISKGQLDSRNITVFLHRLAGVLEDTGLKDVAPIQVRMYRNLGHFTWGEDQLKWPGFFSVMILGNCDLNSLKPECVTMWRSPGSASK